MQTKNLGKNLPQVNVFGIRILFLQPNTAEYNAFNKKLRIKLQLAIIKKV